MVKKNLIEINLKYFFCLGVNFLIVIKCPKSRIFVQMRGIFSKRFTLCLTLLLLASCGQYKQEATPPQISLKTTDSVFLPESNIILQRQNYILAYDGRIRSAGWVYEELTAASIVGSADRSHYEFMEDPQIPSLLRSTKKDYEGSGYDRGHLCPAADARASPGGMQETFYLSNITPQDSQLNRKYWLKLEKYIRHLTKSYDVIYVITGPLFMPQKSKEGKRFIKYEVIGDNDVAVPTHYFKVIRAKRGHSIDTEAYIIPNQPIKKDPPLTKFRVSLEKVEKAAGILFRGS